MKIGDWVKHKNMSLEGEITDIRLCTGGMEKCPLESLSLTPENMGVRFYYHVESFELVTPSA